MTNPRATFAPIGSFAEAQRFRLKTALRLSHAERLRDLEAMWEFNDMVEQKNPRLRRIAARLRERREEERQKRSL